VGSLVITAVKVAVLLNLLLMIFSGMTYIERRLLAFMQFRLGPNRTGPFGLLQPIADGIKLFFKEEVVPEGANKWLFVIAPGLAIVTAFLSIAVVPFGGTVTIGGYDILKVVA
jgi:NADH-quinone oxidoreductase subunit H